MDEAAEWRALAEQFVSLQKGVEGKLYVSHLPTAWAFGDESWRIGGASDELRDRFEDLAERAGVLLGETPGPPALLRWFNELKEESPRYQIVRHSRRLPDGTTESAEGGTIPDVCAASANHCYRLETAAINRALNIGAANAVVHRQSDMHPSVKLAIKSIYADAEAEIEARKQFMVEKRLRELREQQGTPPLETESTETLPQRGESTRNSEVDAFLERCNQHSPVRVRRRHIWQSAGHTSGRQFEYWQASDKKATGEDHRNFSRILGMQPAEFVATLRKQKIIVFSDIR
jgi:hypothetical protein